MGRIGIVSMPVRDVGAGMGRLRGWPDITLSVPQPGSDRANTRPRRGHMQVQGGRKPGRAGVMTGQDSAADMTREGVTIARKTRPYAGTKGWVGCSYMVG